MKQLASIFRPFEKVNRIYSIAILVCWIGIGLLLWTFAPDLLPNPVEVGKALWAFLTSMDFYEDLFHSIFLTLKAMGISIVIASVVAYLSTTAFFYPIAKFLTILRYMSLVGLIFAFTIVLKDGGTVKLSLLMFGIIPFFVLSLLSVISKVGKEEYELCQTLKYSKWEMLYELVIWGRRDQTLETIRANLAIGWLMITMVESFSMAEGGIGVQLFRANKFNALDRIFALQSIIFILGIFFDYCLQQLRSSTFPHVKLEEIK